MQPISDDLKTLALDGVLIIGAGALIWFLWFRHGGQDGGQSLLPALGFPYGPMGNLPAVGGDNRAGNLSGASPAGGAFPTWLSPTGILQDMLGNWLTDMSGQYLTDMSGFHGPNFVINNPSSLRFTLFGAGSPPA